MFNSPNKSVGVIKGAPPQGKNLIINGNLTVDQRQGSDPNFIADRWKVVDANNMTQIIEDVNFEPNTEYTLSWEGGTPQQITSPASGHWTLPNIPRTARKIQLEVGDEATEFEYEDYGTTLAKCMRYAVVIRIEANRLSFNIFTNINDGSRPQRSLPVEMRAKPTIIDLDTGNSPQVTGVGAWAMMNGNTNKVTDFTFTVNISSNHSYRLIFSSPTGPGDQLYTTDNPTIPRALFDAEL